MSEFFMRQDDIHASDCPCSNCCPDDRPAWQQNERPHRTEEQMEMARIRARLRDLESRGRA